MARRYVKVTIRMIADWVPGTAPLVREDLTTLLNGMQAIEAGKIDVEFDIRGEVQVNEHGYARRWPYKDG